MNVVEQGADRYNYYYLGDTIILSVFIQWYMNHMHNLCFLTFDFELHFAMKYAFNCPNVQWENDMPIVDWYPYLQGTSYTLSSVKIQIAVHFEQ